MNGFLDYKMEIFINEVSLEGQYLTDAEFKDAVIIFKSIFDLLNKKTKQKIIYKEDSNLFVNYDAIKGSNFQQSLNQIKDKSLKLAFKNIVFNKLNAKEWRKEQVHSLNDYFDYFTPQSCRDVRNTSLAEVAERQFQNSYITYLVINFTNSSFIIAHPDISKCCLISIIKNNDETQSIDLDSLDNQAALENWLEKKLKLSKIEYDESSTVPPQDEQTILRDTKRFKRTRIRYDERVVYCEISTGKYWYVDNLHYGKAAHLEVFDKTGQRHLGEADLQGEIDESKSDSEKTINIS
ncbi:hypothetical protein [Coleofasciculus chthonoplastes]|nr:hypothetical protein [Coleofasciculus chthonoplastes]